MHQNTNIYRSWLPNWLIVILLILCLFPHLTLMAVFSTNSTFTSSFLDIDKDDIQFMISMMYGMIVCGLFYNQRLFRYFNVKTYLLLMTSVTVLTLLAMIVTQNHELLYVLRFVQGPFSFLEGCILLPLLMAQLKTKNAKIIAMSVLYTLLMTSSTFTTSLVKYAIEYYDYKTMMLTLVFIHILAMLVYVIILNSKRFFPKHHLYKLNFHGIMLLSFACISGSYFFVYGLHFNWFESRRIGIAFFLFILCSGLFAAQQLTDRRPVFHFEILFSERVLLGIFLFFVLYIIRAGISNIYGIMATVWKWPWEFVLNMQYWMVFGTISGAFAGYLMMRQKTAFRYIFFTGFLILSVSTYWFSKLFVSEISYEHLAGPLFLLGLAQGITFCPIVIFMTSTTHPNLMSNASVSGVAVRFWTTTIGYAVMQNLQFFLSRKHLFSMSSNLTVNRPVFAEVWSASFTRNLSIHTYNDAMRLSIESITGKLSAQALLLSNTEIFTVTAVISLTTALCSLLYTPVRQHIRKNKRTVYISRTRRKIILKNN